ncbi:MAG: protein kinase [Polyangiaceae bacterium]|nr:protein kinase [Polyangiaceae bacterium]
MQGRASPEPPALPPGGASLGPFRLLELLGEGAMGVVWRGVHGPTRLQVAVKVMTAEVAQEPAYAAALRNEVAAVARLHHPGIVRVYDFGLVPPDAAAAAPEVLAAGSPYLVMQLARGGTLEERGRPTDWPALKTLLLGLCDALAHAHARGVVHRDIKPQNVLLAASGDEAPSPMLSDFGLAHALHDDEGAARAQFAACGTPIYMAPEQFTGEWRDHGPWTDLYALGCVAHELASGAPPFCQDVLTELAHAHMFVPPPELVPVFELPRAFAAWLRAMLAKRPEDRFQRAADAAFALAEVDAGERLRPSAAGRAAAGLTLLHTIVLPESLPPGAPSIEARPGTTLVSRDPPPLPDSWHRPVPRPEPPLVGAGLGLFGVRSIPLVDREQVLDVLWQSLRDVHESGRARAVVLRGVAGTGKTRIARWLAERADEVGGAVVLHAVHSAEHGRNDGVLAMLGRGLGCQDMAPAALAARLRRKLLALGEAEPYFASALAELFGGGDAASRLRDGSGADADARLRVVLRLVGLWSRERPLVLVIDDAHWGLEALRLGAALCAAPETLPVLVLFTLRDEALVPGSLEAEACQRLLAGPRARAVEVRELAPEDHRLLARHLLGLAPSLAERVASRTEGNPLFAVQLVGDWVARGVLRPGQSGLELVPGETEVLPGDVHALCAARVTGALAGRSAEECHALELFALLGAEVDEPEWRAACAHAALEVAPDLLAALAGRGLLEPGYGRWRFAQGLLREALVGMARAGGRWQALNRVVADVLRSGRRSAETAGRIGRHLRQAGDLDAAAPALLQAARLLRFEADFARARELAREHDLCLDELGAGPDDPRRGEAQLLLARIDLDQGRADEALARAAAAGERARRLGHESLAARADLLRAEIGVDRGDGLAAVGLCQRALETLRRAGDWRGEHDARAALASAYYYLGDAERAGEAYRGNLAQAEDLGDELAVADALWGLGYVALWQERHAEARASFERMREILVRHGAGYRLGACFNALGELARLSGRPAEAEQHYLAWGRVMRAYGTGGEDTLRVNLALTRLAEDDFAGAVPFLIETLAPAGREGRKVHAVAGALASTILVRAHETELEPDALHGLPSADDALHELERLVEESSVCEGDLAQTLARAAQDAHARGQTERARRAAVLARAQWRALGRTDRAAALDALAGLDA